MTHECIFLLRFNSVSFAYGFLNPYKLLGRIWWRQVLKSIFKVLPRFSTFIQVLDLDHSSEALAGYLGSLSCWKVNLQTSLMYLADWNVFFYDCPVISFIYLFSKPDQFLSPLKTFSYICTKHCALSSSVLLLFIILPFSFSLIFSNSLLHAKEDMPWIWSSPVHPQLQILLLPHFI